MQSGAKPNTESTLTLIACADTKIDKEEQKVTTLNRHAHAQMRAVRTLLQDWLLQRKSLVGH